MHREHEITQWGIARNLIGPTGQATPHGQVCKTLEEATELLDAINRSDRDAVRDAVGDIVVTLVMQAGMWGLSIDECVEQAWCSIKDRKGRMVGGVFVKDAS